MSKITIALLAMLIACASAHYISKDVQGANAFAASAVGGPREKLLGTYVAECDQSSWFDPESRSEFNVSSLVTTKYFNNGSFISSHVEYLAKTQAHGCNPALTDDFAWYFIRGTFKPTGVNKVNPSYNNGEWDHESSTWLFPNNAVGSTTKYILEELNAGCSCGGRWAEGVERTVDAKKDCTAAERTQDNPFYLCAIVIGLPGYSVYEYVNEDNNNAYRAGPIRFDPVEGYNEKPISAVRNQIFEGGNTNPTNCDYQLYGTCGVAVDVAVRACYGCQDIECDGCIFTEIDDLTGLPEDIGLKECCPCIWNYAERYQQPWMKISC